MSTDETRTDGEKIADAEVSASVEDEAAASGDESPEEPLDPLTEALIERDDYLSALQRLQADFENYKKRAGRQGEELAARTVMSLISTMLPIFDHLDLAVAHASVGESIEDEASRALLSARTTLYETLAKAGLTRVDTAEVAFDPSVHDAVAHAPGEGDTIVDEVLRAGYLWQGSVIRPAMVRVRG